MDPTPPYGLAPTAPPYGATAYALAPVASAEVPGEPAKRAGGGRVWPVGLDSVGTGVDGAEPAPGTSHGFGVSPDAAGVEAATLSPVAAARSHGLGGGAAIREGGGRN